MSPQAAAGPAGVEGYSRCCSIGRLRLDAFKGGVEPVGVPLEPASRSTFVHDPSGAIDGVRDQQNLPLASEPESVVADLQAAAGRT
ncbi:hypothetical protein M1D93_08870 [Arthrobacter sp. Z1-9]